MKYIEVDLKQERCIVDQTQQSTVFQPSCEYSYERLTGENGQEFAAVENVEELICREDEVYRLHTALLQLDNQERALIDALFFEGLSERQLAKRMGTPQRTIHDRKVKILRNLKNLMNK